MTGATADDKVRDKAITMRRPKMTMSTFVQREVLRVDSESAGPLAPSPRSG